MLIFFNNKICLFRYVQEKVDPEFNHSTDSDTDQSEDEERPTGRGTLV